MQSEQPSNGHLGTAWEIAIVVIFVGLVAIILAATVFQVRRRRRQKRQRELENDIENAKTPKGKTRSQEKRRRTGSIHTVDGITEKQSDAVGAGDGRSIDEVIRKPSPSFQLKQANDSSYNEYLSKKPPNYYWEERLN
ncbi:hypothetical protein AGABI2DRAFT_190206 [Agaricus bisporus var. bisporus H97]|uniref:hypothetical protein n=1 Tax=Agaricus bisporus var. bisporus (strain H97 / ATCC MYA-4626 / FGSC 10389) TaxID=936046 RepID=UPI00029F5249|nr:hypothetical protein AGABI2DRAFT_190206 [Agaricus bisporus var. bisporus H97]EKV49739.1 hypothetical protein AGABI2DRAFT_190206 [Agaricus bisporus var. bisporus H97]